MHTLTVISEFVFPAHIGNFMSKGKRWYALFKRAGAQG